MGNVDRFLAIACFFVISGVLGLSEEPKVTPHERRVSIKVFLEIQAPGGVSESVEAQITSQFEKMSNISLVSDRDTADHIFQFDIHEVRLRSDFLTGYAIVVIWKFRKAVREIATIFGSGWNDEQRTAFDQYIANSSFYGWDAFYTCAPDGLKQRLSKIISDINNRALNKL
jgi:hypothetical protein